jgi:hypothetical protein
VATNKDFIVKNGLSVGEDISVSGSVTSNLQFDDSVEIQLGTDSDFRIYHDNTHAWIRDSGDGDLFVDTDGAKISLISGGSYATGKMADFVKDGAVTLYHDNSGRLATTSTGVDITGDLAVSGDLNITGDINSVSVTDLDVTDKTITLASGGGGGSAADGAGIIVDGASASLVYALTGDKWVFNKAPYLNTNRILTSADTGTGNSLDADMVDGKHFDDIISEATALAIALG